MNLNTNICGSGSQKKIVKYHLVNELKNIPQKKKQSKTNTKKQKTSKDEKKNKKKKTWIEVS